MDVANQYEWNLFFPGIEFPQNWIERWINRQVLRRQRKSGNPADFIIYGPRGEGDPAVYRWWIIPRNRFFNIYLHKFMQDDKQHLHDHPWWNCSLPLVQGYGERMFIFNPAREGIKILPPTYIRRCKPWRLYFRRADTPHQVIVDSLPLSDGWQNVPSWSLFFTGPRVQTWGFWCPNGVFKRPYTEYSQSGPDYGKTGRGCE